MAKKVLNSVENYESLCVLKLDELFKRKFPIAYQNKKDELMEECGYSEDEAENVMKDMEVEIELYYEKGTGFFAVESEAVEAGTIYSPYTKDEYSEPETD